MKTAGDRPASIRALPIRADRLIGICGKCGRKIGGGFGPGGGKALSKSLRRAAGDAKGKRAKLKIVETKCLDICPKRAVALIDSNRPGRVLIVPIGVTAERVAAELGISRFKAESEVADPSFAQELGAAEAIESAL